MILKYTLLPLFLIVQCNNAMENTPLFSRCIENIRKKSVNQQKLWLQGYQGHIQQNLHNRSLQPAIIPSQPSVKTKPLTDQEIYLFLWINDR